MRQFFVCEVCGKSYPEIQAAQACESKGVNPEYAVGDILIYSKCQQGILREVGVIHTIRYSNQEHLPIYKVKVLGEDPRGEVFRQPRKQRTSRVFSKDIFRTVTRDELELWYPGFFRELSTNGEKAA